MPDRDRKTGREKRMVAMAGLQRQTVVVAVVSCLLLVVTAVKQDDNKVPVVGVSIEDFIDLDAPTSSGSSKDGFALSAQTGNDPGPKTTVGHGNYRIKPSYGPLPPPLPVPKGDAFKPSLRHRMTSDDEDVELSGDGSGSGGGLQIEEESAPEFTQHNKSGSGAKSKDHDQKNNTTVELSNALDVKDVAHVPPEKVDKSLSSDLNLTVSDVIYTADVWPPVPVREQTDEGEVKPLWSPWIRTNEVTEIRVRTCSGNDECNGTEAELRHCDADSSRCDVTGAVVMSEEAASTLENKVQCQDDDVKVKKEPKKKEPKKTSKTQEHSRAPLAPGEIDLQRTELEPCTYSLFDLKRGKYLISQWSLTRLVTQAKVKKWCARPREYMVFTSPHQHCRRYYKDLCHVSMRCKGSRSAPKARGDFAEGCWRQFVYGGQLPVGLSNRQTIVYLICQRYAANSALGKMFGHKRSHFATLYDTKGRAPVVSLMKVTQLGDTAWPNTPFFIEHGLVEDAEDTAWFLRKAKKGIVALSDMGKCQHEDGCQLAAHQVLPSDYSATLYRTAHLVWPELAGPDPLSRAATFTLTNTAPMHAALYPHWHRAVLRVRRFALKQCGLPETDPAHFVSTQHHHPHHRYHHPAPSDAHKPALYLASGVIPSRDPMETIGNDVNVPVMFWMAACCVSTNSSATESKDKGFHRHNDYASLFRDQPRDSDKQHLSFAIYARNAGSREERRREGEGWREQVVAAPVLQLEMLLQDIYKTLPTDADVNLFPASQGACSELSNDFSRSVQL